MLETIAFLQFPARLRDQCKVKRKSEKLLLEKEKSQYSRLEGKLEQLKSSLITAKTRFSSYSDQKEKTLKLLLAKSENFEVEKEANLTKYLNEQQRFLDERTVAVVRLRTQEKLLLTRIAELEAVNSDPCPTCGNIKSVTEQVQELKVSLSGTTQLIANERAKVDPFKDKVLDAKARVNHYAEQYKQELIKENPFLSSIKDTELELECTQELSQKQGIICDNLQEALNLLAQMHDLSVDLRKLLLTQAVTDVQNSTNKYLEKYFDAELKVELLLSSDNIEVEIQKSGHQCSYGQLSKGQRSLLKLCFSISVMQLAAQKSGTQITTLFFDEALDGLDTNLKVKSFNLFSELETSYSSIFIIDHSTEFKLLCNKTYHVSLEQDNSTIVEV